MALIKCPECGKEISDKASSCPGCGYKIKKRLKIIKPKFIILIVLLLLLMIGGIFFCSKHFSDSIPNGLSLTLDMTKDDVHNKIGGKFILEKDKYNHDVEIYDLEWCSYDGKLSIIYSTDGNRILNWKWEIDTSDMTNQDIEDAMKKIRDKISNKYGEAEENNVSSLSYKWVTTHIEKTGVIFDVGYELIRGDILWLHYGEVY